jgi:hypothetical protein
MSTSRQTIEDTSIWKRTLAEQENDTHKDERERLRSVFFKTRENIEKVVSLISGTLPDLTLHDISHLDYLWEIASIIVGDDFEINPLEGFVLGCSFLAHDSVLSFEAYKGGKTALRETAAWKDSFAELTDNKTNLSQDELEHQTDFSALRELHAKQCSDLLFREWETPDGKKLFLLEDSELRNHLGKLIGEISSSHHWDIEKVQATFNSQINVPSSYPREWHIDPFKIACILRCADAAHIDSTRAPDFLYALIKRNGVSLNHWTGQNHLGKVSIDNADEKHEALLYTSTIDFDENESSAWYIIFDALCVIEKEIKSCNNLLEQKLKKCFKVRHVKGIESPQKLSQYVKANNWQPCSAQIHIDNVKGIIENLGGENLYGSSSDKIEIILRELIQNARDAIKARKYFDQKFLEKISIKIETIDNDIWITIEDNGIGMSERVLTGPLLDFGVSFWSSSLIKTEFPGLRSSDFKSIGKFGIGFYSVFMAAETVFVSSHHFESGLNDVIQLKFVNGLSLRPILIREKPDGFNTSISTQIKLKIKTGLIRKDYTVEIKTNRLGSSKFDVPIRNYIAALCAGLDTDVYLIENKNTEVKVHENINSPTLNIKQWLYDISFAQYNKNDPSVSAYINSNINRLKTITDGKNMYGLAAINTRRNDLQDYLGTQTVGGLATTVHSRSGDTFIGYIDKFPKSAKRDIGGFSASNQVIKDWARNQLNELLKLPLNPWEKYFVASSLCSFKVDPSELLNILISYNSKIFFISLLDLVELSKNTEIYFFLSGFGMDHIETHHTIQHVTNAALFLPIINSSLLSAKITNNIPENNYSVIDCFYRKIISLGNSAVINKIPTSFKTAFGQEMDAITIKTV